MWVLYHGPCLLSLPVVVSICSDSVTVVNAVDELREAAVVDVAGSLLLTVAVETGTEAGVPEEECFSSQQHQNVVFLDYWHLV